jgi:hypothetical protein
VSRKKFGRTPNRAAILDSSGVFILSLCNHRLGIFGWIDAVRRLGARTGICSAIDVPEGNSQINTAENILQLDRERVKSKGLPQTSLDLKLWVANDQSPPAPGCTVANLQPSLGARLIDRQQPVENQPQFDREPWPTWIGLQSASISSRGRVYFCRATTLTSSSSAC